MSDEKKDDFISVNQVLNIKPRLGPIPGEQVFPWIAIFFVSYLLCQGVMGLSWVATGLVTLWGVGTWWCVTGDESWRFLTKFSGVPTWTRGHAEYTVLVEPAAPKGRKQARKSRFHHRSTRKRIGGRS